jgi:hypothetical protein
MKILWFSFPQEHAHVWGEERQYLLFRYLHPLNLPNGTPRALPDGMRRDTGMFVVNGNAIGARHGLPTFQQYGSDRRKRRCKLCQQAGDMIHKISNTPCFLCQQFTVNLTVSNSLSFFSPPPSFLFSLHPFLHFYCSNLQHINMV